MKCKHCKEEIDQDQMGDDWFHQNKYRKCDLKAEPLKGKFNYLTESEAIMPLEMALLQLALGLQTCKTKGDVVELLKDAVELGRRENNNSDAKNCRFFSPD